MNEKYKIDQRKEKRFIENPNKELINMDKGRDLLLKTVKTKISSENTALIYEKNKAYGLLYR